MSPTADRIFHHAEAFHFAVTAATTAEQQEAAGLLRDRADDYAYSPAYRYTCRRLADLIDPPAEDED